MSTPTLNTVPPELVSLIFEHARWRCTREELARIALTSSYLNAVITPALYTTVIADDERFLFSIRAALARDPSKGLHVRNLVLPRHQSIAAQVHGSNEWHSLHDAQLDVLLACPRIVSLELSPLSEAIVAAVPWGSVRRLSLVSRSAAIYAAVFASCTNVTHLNLFDLRFLVREFSVFDAVFGQRADAGEEQPAPASQHRFDALDTVSCELTDPQHYEDEPPILRVIDLVHFFCTLPSTRRVLLLLFAYTGFNTRLTSVDATRTWELVRPLKSEKVYIALHARGYDVWTRAIDEKEQYDELGQRVWSAI
ncbi:hypothetical protein AURDEDRAFT_165667 [Auricularia subglabra TFB-10046 SS5]|nr:hypothetical protein AURDEDRAFT_165667 [Auricularia subglabra TFB-10046 SS5]